MSTNSKEPTNHQYRFEIGSEFTMEFYQPISHWNSKETLIISQFIDLWSL